LNTLNALIRDRNFDNTFREIVRKFPSVIKVFPILLAIRDVELEVIDLSKSLAEKYDFSLNKPTEKDIEKFLTFFRKTGLKDFFVNMVEKSIYDYIMGVEVGLDTHARKNRSGDIMEKAIKPFLEELDDSYKVLFQKKFDYLDNYRIKVSSGIKNRKADVIIIKENKKIINIEINFYEGSGSKPQEIVDSYINRQKDLKNNGFYFIWITEGKGWAKQQNQLRKAFNEIDFILNLSFVSKGYLTEIIKSI
jgi:type II restriction enzyme